MRRLSLRLPSLRFQGLELVPDVAIAITSTGVKIARRVFVLPTLSPFMPVSSQYVFSIVSEFCFVKVKFHEAAFRALLRCLKLSA